MLIVSSHIADLSARAPVLAEWPGPHLAILHPGHGLSEPELTALEETFILYDLADEEPCQLSLLRVVLLHAEARGWAPEGPILLVSGEVGQDELSALALEADNDPGMMRYEGAADEDALASGEAELVLLLLGRHVTETPLVMTFFRNMEPDLSAAHTRTSLDLLQEHLG